MRKKKKARATKAAAAKKSKPVAKKKKAARATKAASVKRPTNFALIVPASLKTALAQRAKAAGMANWKAFANSLLNPTAA